MNEKYDLVCWSLRNKQSTTSVRYIGITLKFRTFLVDLINSMVNLI